MAFEVCWRCLNRPAGPVANRVFALTVLHRLTRPYPKLEEELRRYLLDQMPFESAGFRARGRRLRTEEATK